MADGDESSLHDAFTSHQTSTMEERGGDENVAGPSRLRGGSTSSTHRGSADQDGPVEHGSSHHRSPPASPETAFSRAESPPRPSTPHLNLATYPTATLLRLLASLLHQIATANDQLRPDLEETEDEPMTTPDDAGSRSDSRQSHHSHPNPSPTTALFPSGAHSSAEPPITSLATSDLPLFTASRTSLAHPSSLLSFHARHVPSITIEAYLLRILKYCPTTNEVFLGLLVYFDRMSRLGTATGVGGLAAARGGRGFAIDSYNVHRLVIAGVTVASKFFSDVFYTNSRYAKVGGLPSHELNQLELQFLLLNDFRLVILPDEMQRYGDRLLGYWEGKEAETGVDVASGRELSDRGRSAGRGSGENAQAGAGTARAQAPARQDAGPTVADVHAATHASEKMEVDENPARTDAASSNPLVDGMPFGPASSSRGPISGPADPPRPSQPSPTSSPTTQPATEHPPVAPRGKERDRPTGMEYAQVERAGAGGVSNGPSGWGRADEGVGVGQG